MFIALSVCLHVILMTLVLPTLLALRPSPALPRPTPVSFLDESSGPSRPSSSALAEKKPEEEKVEEPEEKDPERERGQIVDVAPPTEERRPDDTK